MELDVDVESCSVEGKVEHTRSHFSLKPSVKYVVFSTYPRAIFPCVGLFVHLSHKYIQRFAGIV